MAAQKRKLTTQDDIQNFIFESESELSEFPKLQNQVLSILQHQKNQKKNSK